MKAFVFLIVLFFILAVNGCKKDEGEKPNCRITAINSSTRNYILTCNNEGGLLSTIYNGNAVTGFTYSGNTITALTTQNGGVFFSKEYFLC